MAKQRQTNLEILRIVAMLFVLILHTNMGFSPWPLDDNAISTDPYYSYSRLLIEGLAIVCVNVFILLSGWFGISFSYKKLLYLVFQIVFFALVLLFIPCQHGEWTFASFWVAISHQYWFIFAYIILFILAPVLNLFSQYAPRQLFEQVLVAFFCIQTFFSYFGNFEWFTDGMSPIPFIGLYLLARYIRLFQPSFATLNKYTDLIIYLSISIAIAVISLALIKWAGTGGRMFNYTNPFVIIASLYFFLFFSKLKVRHLTFVNWISCSCLGVYLFHTHPNVISKYFIGTISQLRSMTDSGAVTVFMCLLFIIAVFLTGIMADKVYCSLWNLLTGITPRKNR